jgi:hypothetical protein
LSRLPLEKLEANEADVIRLLHRWREEATKAGRQITRVVVPLRLVVTGLAGALAALDPAVRLLTDLARDPPDLILPQRFFGHQQRSNGNRHIYASRTRLISCGELAAISNAVRNLCPSQALRRDSNLSRASRMWTEFVAGNRSKKLAELGSTRNVEAKTRRLS